MTGSSQSLRDMLRALPSFPAELPAFDTGQRPPTLGALVPARAEGCHRGDDHRAARHHARHGRRRGARLIAGADLQGRRRGGPLVLRVERGQRQGQGAGGAARRCPLVLLAAAWPPGPDPRHGRHRGRARGERRGLSRPLAGLPAPRHWQAASRSRSPIPPSWTRRCTAPRPDLAASPGLVALGWTLGRADRRRRRVRAGGPRAPSRPAGATAAPTAAGPAPCCGPEPRANPRAPCARTRRTPRARGRPPAGSRTRRTSARCRRPD